MQGRDCIEWDAIGRRAEDGSQMTEVRGQKAEDGGQKAEDGGQKAEFGGGNCWNAECGMRKEDGI